MNVTDDMVSRFLCWKLPQDFGPDCGISFTKFHPNGTTHFEPTGTNLLTAVQARAMLQHVLSEPAQEPSAYSQALGRAFGNRIGAGLPD